MNWKERVVLCVMCGLALVLAFLIAGIAAGIVERLFWIWVTYR